MARRVYHSFHYARDVARVAQVRQIGSLEGQRILAPNDWEQVRRGGDRAIRRWIKSQMRGKSCVVVLIGSLTSRRPWVEYEIKRGWGEGRALLGVHIHNLRNLDRAQSRKGANPFRGFTINYSGEDLASVVPCHDPPFVNSKRVYRDIAENLEEWVEEAIAIRRRYPR